MIADATGKRKEDTLRTYYVSGTMTELLMYYFHWNSRKEILGEMEEIGDIMLKMKDVLAICTCLRICYLQRRNCAL